MPRPMSRRAALLRLYSNLNRTVAARSLLDIAATLIDNTMLTTVYMDRLERPQMKYLAMLLMVFLIPTGHATDLSFIRDYTCKASDPDCKVSARSSALTRAPFTVADAPPDVVALNTQSYAMQPPTNMPVDNTSADYSGYVRAAQLTEVYSLLMPIKMTMTEYYMLNGAWPSSLEQINLRPEEMTDGQYLEKVRLGDDGRILAYLSSTFGKNKLLSLAPKSIMGGMQTRWECTTNVVLKGTMGLSSLKCKQDKHLR